MSDRYIPGVPCWVDTTQPDPAAAVEFYSGLFGWQTENVLGSDSPGAYYIGRLPGGDVAAVSSAMGEAPPVAMWNTYVWVDSADETAEKVRAAGGAVLTEPFDVMESGRMAVFADTEGAVFCAWQPNQHRGAQVVNEPGSLNFNTLHARDLEAAAAFYGAVFGWEMLDFGDGSGGFWALPAYADFLEARMPGMRKNMAEMGAPARFEEVVAAVSAITDDTSPHWGVTFAVDDADATAAKATELGGSVLVPPMDAPWVRMTVLQDPQGATFIASKFVPENKDIAVDAGAAAA